MHHLSPVLQISLAKAERQRSVAGRRQQQRQRLLLELLSLFFGLFLLVNFEERELLGS